MLDKFKKLLNVGSEQAAETITLAVDTSAAQAELSTMQVQLEAVAAEFGVKLQAADGKIAEMAALLQAAQAELAAVYAEKAEMVAKSVATKLATRKEKVVAAIGTGKSDALMAATESLDDAAFEAVVSAMAGSVDAEAKTGLFQEVGVTAEADAAKVVEESKEMKLLKKQYGAK